MDAPEAIYFIDTCHEDCWRLCDDDYVCYNQCAIACEQPEVESAIDYEEVIE